VRALRAVAIAQAFARRRLGARQNIDNLTGGPAHGVSGVHRIEPRPALCSLSQNSMEYREESPAGE
jgi:hypothetical protein